jgi:hypothetical protein
MTELLDLLFLVVGLFAAVSGLLYVLAAIDPQTDANRRNDQAGSRHVTQ